LLALATVAWIPNPWPNLWTLSRKRIDQLFFKDEFHFPFSFCPETTIIFSTQAFLQLAINPFTQCITATNLPVSPARHRLYTPPLSAMFAASRRHRCYIYSDDEDMDDCSLRYRVPGAGGPSSVRRVSWDANGTACFVEEHPGDGHVRVKREPDFLDELVGGERVSVNHSWSSINEWGRNRFPRAPVLKRPRRHGAPRRPPWHPSCGTYLPPPPVGPSSPQPPRPRIIPS
jgi:hypothetical protein